MQTFPLPLCQGIRGLSVTKQKALAKAAVFARMKRSAASLSEEEALEIHKQSRTAEQREQDKGDSYDHGVDVQIGSDSAAHAGDDGIA